MTTPGDDFNTELPYVPVSAEGQTAWPLFNDQTNAYANDSRVVFLFSNFDAPALALGRKFYDNEPAFRRAIDRCANLLRPLMDESLTEVLWGNVEQSHFLSQSRYANPAMFSLQYALAELWFDRGIIPDAVAGCGLGEFTAACIAGVFQLKDALTMVCLQAGLLETASDEKVANCCHGLLNDFILSEPKLDYISTLTGEAVSAELANPEYWKQQMTWPTCFEKAVSTLIAHNYHTFVEIGAKPDLSRIGKSLVDQSNNVWLSSLREDVPETDHFRRCLSILFKTGVPMSLPAFEMLG